MGKEGKQEVLPVNRRAKDTFFKAVYGTEERQRELAAFLLGAEGREVRTANVRPVLFGNKENDLALLCDDALYMLAEEQAPLSPNVTYRMLEYATAGLRSLVDSERLLYGKGRVYFPVPKLYVLQVWLERNAGRLPAQVQYDIRLSDSYVTPDGPYRDVGLDVTVHVYDFRMSLGETLGYIEDVTLPARFQPYDNDMRDYALVANGITYMQRVQKDNGYEARQTWVRTVAEYLGLLLGRGIFVDLLSDKEVVYMTMAQFSRDDILRYQDREEGRKEGREEGRIEGAIRTYKKTGG